MVCPAGCTNSGGQFFMVSDLWIRCGPTLEKYVPGINESMLNSCVCGQPLPAINYDQSAQEKWKHFFRRDENGHLVLHRVSPPCTACGQVTEYPLEDTGTDRPSARDIIRT